MRNIRLSDEEMAALVHAVEAREDGAAERLYDLMRKSFRYYLVAQIGQASWEDRLNNAYVAVLQAIRRKKLERPSAVLGFAQTIVYREICEEIQHRVQQRADGTAASQELKYDGFRINQHIDRERRVAIMMQALSQLCPRDQELLRRFYLLEQPIAQIQKEMNLTYTQFRLLKSRAKKRIGIRGAAIQRPSLLRESAKAKTHSA